MQKSLSFVSLLLLLLFATMSFAADANGTWKGSSKEGPWVFKLKSEAGTVTGNTYSMEGKELPINSGKLDGDTISFSFDSEWQGQPITLVAKGSVKADTMSPRSVGHRLLGNRRELDQVGEVDRPATVDGCAGAQIVTRL